MIYVGSEKCITVAETSKKKTALHFKKLLEKLVVNSQLCNNYLLLLTTNVSAKTKKTAVACFSKN